MKKSKNEIKNKQTIRTIDKEDRVIETTESGLPGTIIPSDDEVEEELHGMQGYREFIKHSRDDDNGGHGLNFGDW
jgi:hypothetical protein